jgi:hypothetical protein
VFGLLHKLIYCFVQSSHLHFDSIDQTDEDVEGLVNFRNCLLTPELALSTVDLLYNRIGNDPEAP